MNETSLPGVRSEPFIMPCFNTHIQVKTTHDARSAAQFETVRNLVARDDFDFSCYDKCFCDDPETRDYRGPFAFLWYDKSGTLWLSWILWNGKIVPR